MKKIYTIVLLLLMGLGLQAQTKQKDGNAQEKKAIEQIRARYAEAKRMIEYNNSSLETRNQLVVNGSYMCSGSGHCDEVVAYYFTTDFDEESGNFVRMPYIIQRSYNVAARKFYEEYLYDEKGNLVFVLMTNDSYEKEGPKDENRFYWGGSDKGLIREDVKGQKTIDEVMAARIAYDLMEAFNRLMNREF